MAEADFEELTADIDEFEVKTCPKDGASMTVDGCEGCDRLRSCWDLGEE